MFLSYKALVGRHLSSSNTPGICCCQIYVQPMYLKILSPGLVVKNRIAMAPNVKGFALETFLSGKFPLWYFQFSPLASPHDRVQMWADPAATTIILLCVCLEVWCVSLFTVVYILMTSSICVILFGCCSLTNFRAQSLTNHVYCTGLCSELRQCNGIYFKHRISEVILTWVMY